MKDNDAEQNARRWLETIVEHYSAINALQSGEVENVKIEGYEYDAEGVDEKVQDMPLSVQVRSDWTDPGTELTPAEYCILLTTGGPALRIVGDLDNCEPDNARLEWQDWGTPWSEFRPGQNDGAEPEDWEDALLWFSQQFYFGQ